jgi:glucose-6-phosphate 1-dehydrogenase
MSDDDYRAWLKERFQEVEGAKRPSDEEFARFAGLLHYLRLDLAAPCGYAQLKAWLARASAGGAGRRRRHVPRHQPRPVPDDLRPARRRRPERRCGPVVLEKPLGHDLASAREINRVVRSVFREEQAFRIDHYLGKPAVQNLMALRFGNALFEPLWRRESIANIQITLAESIGVETRGDLLQPHRRAARHDPEPRAAAPDDDRDGAAVAQSRRCDPRREAEGAALAQALQRRERRPRRGPRPVPRRHDRRQAGAGFLEEDKVPPGSRTETFVALRTEVQNWRWAGVPFYLRTGKRLAARDAQIVVNFRPTPHAIFPGVSRPNKLVIKLQPEDGLELHLLAAKGAGQSEALAPVSLDLDFDKAFAENRVGRLRAAAARTSSPAGSTCSCAATSRRRPGPGSSRSCAPGRATMPGRGPMPPAPGDRLPRARWWRATATSGRKRNSEPGRRSGQRDLPPELAPGAGLERVAPVHQGEAEARVRRDLPADLGIGAADPAAARPALRGRIGRAAMQHDGPGPRCRGRRRRRPRSGAASPQSG